MRVDDFRRRATTADGRRVAPAGANGAVAAAREAGSRPAAASAAGGAGIAPLEARALPDTVLRRRSRMARVVERLRAVAVENGALRDEVEMTRGRIEQMTRDLEQTTRETVAALATILEARDPYTRGHSERVAWLARRIGEELGLADEDLRRLEWAGLLHDVGKFGVPERVLNKPGRLAAEEFELVKNHPRLSAEMLRPVRRFRPILPAVLHHHENFDGSGYPAGLRGEDIPLGARILRIADTFDALTSTRAYRGGVAFEQAIAELARGAGSATDPDVTAAFIRALRREMRENAADFRRRFGHVPLPERDAARRRPSPRRRGASAAS